MTDTIAIHAECDDSGLSVLLGHPIITDGKKAEVERLPRRDYSIGTRETAAREGSIACTVTKYQFDTRCGIITITVSVDEYANSESHTTVQVTGTLTNEGNGWWICQKLAYTMLSLEEVEDIWIRVGDQPRIEGAKAIVEWSEAQERAAARP